MPKVFVFDLGGVLIDWDPRYLYQHVFDTQAEMDFFLMEVCSPAWNLQQDRGRSFREAIVALQAQYPNYSREIALFWERWPDMLKGEIAGTAKIVQALQQHYLVYALSNWSAETFPLLQQHYAFMRNFDGIVLSGEEGMIKPEAGIFEVLLNRYNLLPQDCVFIDDNRVNVEMALQLGFVAVHFTTAEALEKDLRHLGFMF